MGWSARELGELAGTSRRAVRHYQELGLLHEPVRTSNGYRHYDVTHLMRLLRIRRLSELGLPLAMIGQLGDDDQHPTAALQSLRVELENNITRLQNLRDDLDEIVRATAPVDLPVDLAAVTRDLSAADRSLTVVLVRVLRPSSVQAWRALLGPYPHAPAAHAFDSLPPDAAEDARASAAVELAQHMRTVLAAEPEAWAEIDREIGRRPGSRRSIDTALAELYNEAQHDVLWRAYKDLEPDLRAVMGDGWRPSVRHDIRR